MLELALVADELAEKYPMTIFVTVPYTEVANVKENTRNIIVTSQHLDGINPGRGMGFAFAKSLKSAGVSATFLNHAEHPLTLSELTKSVEKAKELDITTIVCADSLLEARAIAMLKPDIILCEPTELIGTGQTSDDDYILKTNDAVKSINPEILVMQAAGISDADDVYRTISLGADGTGCTSGIVKAQDPKQMLKDMVDFAYKANKENEVK